mgnify:CR=1 FL=1
MAKKENRHAELVSASANIDAPYELPEGWEWVTIGDCCEKAFSGKSPKYSKEITPYKIIGQQANQRYGIDLTFIKYGTKEFAEAQQDFYYLQYNDVLLNTLGTGSIGRSGIYKYDEKILTDGHPFVFRTEKKYVADLLFYYLRLNEQEIINTANGSTNQKFLSLKTFLKFPIPLPPTLAEQQRIVNRIETMFSKLDQAQEKAQAVLNSFETRKAAILHKAFNGQLKIDNEELTIDDWEDTTIGECCRLGSGGTPSKSHSEYYENGDIPWLKTGEIDWNDIYDVEERITNEGVENSSAKIFPAESVVVAMYGMGVTRGKAAIIKIPTTTNQAVCILQPNKKLNNRFLFYYFMCNYWQIREQSVGGNQLNLSGKIIASFSIKLPPLNYQLSIVNFLDSVLEKESRAKEAAQTVLDQIAMLKKSILARAFRGEL